jgi:hypothetical protein
MWQSVYFYWTWIAMKLMPIIIFTQRIASYFSPLKVIMFCVIICDMSEWKQWNILWDAEYWHHLSPDVLIKILLSLYTHVTYIKTELIAITHITMEKLDYSPTIYTTKQMCYGTWTWGRHLLLLRGGIVQSVPSTAAISDVVLISPIHPPVLSGCTRYI